MFLCTTDTATSGTAGSTSSKRGIGESLAVEIVYTDMGLTSYRPPSCQVVLPCKSLPVGWISNATQGKTSMNTGQESPYSYRAYTAHTYFASPFKYRASLYKNVVVPWHHYRLIQTFAMYVWCAHGKIQTLLAQ